MQCCVNSKINKIPLVVKILVVSSRGIYVFLFFIHCRIMHIHLDVRHLVHYGRGHLGLLA